MLPKNVRDEYRRHGIHLPENATTSPGGDGSTGSKQKELSDNEYASSLRDLRSLIKKHGGIAGAAKMTGIGAGSIRNVAIKTRNPSRIGASMALRIKQAMSHKIMSIVPAMAKATVVSTANSVAVEMLASSVTERDRLMKESEAVRTRLAELQDVIDMLMPMANSSPVTARKLRAV